MVEFVFVAVDDNPLTRTERGLYHHPKIECAGALRKALKQVFGKVSVQKDPEGGIVALCVNIPMSLKGGSALDQILSEGFEKVAGVARGVPGRSQALSLFILGSDAHTLRRLGVKDPLSRSL